jgi:hypothetical protein
MSTTVLMLSSHGFLIIHSPQEMNDFLSSHFMLLGMGRTSWRKTEVTVRRETQPPAGHCPPLAFCPLPASFFFICNAFSLSLQISVSFTTLLYVTFCIKPVSNPIVYCFYQFLGSGSTIIHSIAQDTKWSPLSQFISKSCWLDFQNILFLTICTSTMLLCVILISNINQYI